MAYTYLYNGLLTPAVTAVTAGVNKQESTGNSGAFLEWYS